ncbi:MAG: hypothetical protein GY756_08195 [bacterium]|nr:hypothetical protein [bacterium]
MKTEKTFRYNTKNVWFKGNTHIHTTASDGGKTIPELDKMYYSEGYDFLFATDHWICSNVVEYKDQTKLLWLDGVEIDSEGQGEPFYHIICLGKLKGVDPSLDIYENVKIVKNQNGFVIMAHPHWCGNTTEDTLRIDFDGVEIYNQVCHLINGKSYGGVHWDYMLMRKQNTFAFAADDAHIDNDEPSWNGGWIKVNCESLTEENVMNAIKAGNFFSSTGPDFLDISYNTGKLYVKTSQVTDIRLVGPSYRHVIHSTTLSGKEYNECEIEVPEDWKYYYLEIENSKGKKAWSNNLFNG